jgi:hypothetical protein
MAKQISNGKRRLSGLGLATSLVRDVCEVAGMPNLIDDAHAELAQAGVIEAVQRHDDATLFGWLLEAMSDQGIADTAAWTFMERNGRTRSEDIAAGISSAPPCPKLKSYWHFQGCGYRKTMQTCHEPAHFSGCPLPRHALRNGSLNQAAYGLWLFIRDVSGGDLVGWIDSRLEQADRPGSPNRARSLVDAVIPPLRNIHGLSDKVLSMSLSMLLLAGDPSRDRWVAAGTAMTAIDTLVHNWLHRTGILRRLNANHLYGPHCYANNGCADIITRLARKIDASCFNANFPAVFPRFVQHAIWRFCAQAGLDQCNGNTVRDGSRCRQHNCVLFGTCERVVMTKPTAD